MVQVYMPHAQTYSFAEAKNALSALTLRANETGTPFIILKNNSPWMEVRPLAVSKRAADAISITPVCRPVPVADLDELFAHYDGSFVCVEDAFAAPVGEEVM